MKNSDMIFPAQFTLDVPTLGDYFGAWAIEEQTFRSLVNRYQGINLHAHVNSQQAAQSVDAQNRDRNFAMTSDGIAMISIRGPMMKSVSSMSDGTSTVRVRQQLRAARKDPEVRGAILVMDTPGGAVKGNQDLANEVAAFRKEKPIYAFTEDMTASAGVSVASQATKRFANQPTALYGGMGTYSVLEDISGMAEQLGVKVHVVRAGEFKGMGEPGTEVTEAHLTEAQRIVNMLNESYLNSIASGLGKPVEEIRAIADGRIHSASDAVGMGLLNGIQTLEETHAQLVAETRSRGIRPPTSSQRSFPMENKTPATLADLKAKFPKSTAEWRESQLEAGADISEAAIAYATHVQTVADKEKAELQKQLEEAKSSGGKASLGHQPVKLQRGKRSEESQGDDDLDYSESGDAIEDFNNAVAKIAGPRADFGRRQRAIRTVATRNPELYQAYLLATNPGKRQTRLITEKMEAFTR